MIFDFVYHGNMLSKHHRDSPPLAKASRWNLSKFVVIKHFGWESLNVQPSPCLHVVVYMLNCVFWRHILLEMEFKSRVDMGSDSNRYSVQRYSPWAAAQLSTPKKNKKKTKNRNGRILRLRLAYGRRSNNYKLHWDWPLTLYITKTCCQNITPIHRPWRQLRVGICQNLSL